MNLFQLKIIAAIAMILDHIAYFFPNSTFITLIFHWIGRISAPIFLFCVVNSIKYTSSKKRYLFRLYSMSVIMAIFQTFSHVELNFFRTLFITALIISILDMGHKDLHKKKIYLSIFIIYQIFACTLCGYLAATSNANTENICFYFIPALLESILTLEDGFLFVALGVLFYLFYEKKLHMTVTYILFILVVTFLNASSIIPILLWKIRAHIPLLGYEISSGLEYFLSVIVGIDITATGGNIFPTQYQWIMIFSLPLLLLYNHEQGQKIKYFFYLFYPFHIILFFFLSSSFVI